jgi:hypothetical protein
VNPQPGHAGELRSSAISEGEEYCIPPGDMIIIPAGTRTWPCGRYQFYFLQIAAEGRAEAICGREKTMGGTDLYLSRPRFNLLQ